MGYTVRSALNELGANAQVEVAELAPGVIKWNRRFLAHLACSPLDDSRVTLHEADVAEIMKVAKCEYDDILLDVDNGPQALNRVENDWLYGFDGLRAAFAALRAKGTLAVWSSGPDPAFSKRLRKARFELDEVKVPVRAVGVGKGGADYVIWIAMRV